MVSKLRSWWEQIQKYRKAISVGAIVLMAVIGLIIIGYLFDWTGFGGYSIIWTPKATNGTSLPITRLEEQQPAKTLWDWFQLLAALAVPVVVGFGAAWFTAKQTQASEASNKQQHETELQIATDNQRETALQAYIDKISELLLKEHLGELLPDGKADQKYRQQNSNKLKPECEAVRNIARVRTITILFQLDARRIGYIFAFLREAGLMSNKPNSSIVSLSLADLSKINLSGANLSEANLSEAILIRANLRRANLSDANLSGADFRAADLSRVNLRAADLSKADLRRADLSDAHLSDAKLSDAILIQADLSDAILIQADLSDAILSDANLRGARLGGARLNRANLLRANLSDAILIQADLSDAKLIQANLSDAHLSDADFRNANLSGAMITEEQLKEAKSLQGATLPDGTKHA